MSADLRALPGMNGAIHAEIPAVDLVVDDAGWNVTLDVTDQLDLRALARAIHADPHLRWCWQILRLNSSSEGMRIMASRDLRKSDAVRAALKLTLGPSQAEDLGETLTDASQPPPEDGAS